MNITSIFQAFNYDLKSFKKLDYSCGIYQNQFGTIVELEHKSGLNVLFCSLTSEVIFAYTDTGQCYIVDEISNFDANSNSVQMSEKDFLSLIWNNSTDLQFEVNEEFIPKIDAEAAKLDLTRSSYINKRIIQYCGATK